jgi:hypothetical protein
VLANHQATFVLRNGQRVSGELTYKGGTSYTLSGRDYPSDDIALIEFVGGTPSADELRQIPSVDNNPSEHERHVFVTRNGEVIFGKIYHISADGNTITFDRREGGRQDISADQLARVYVNPAGARSVYANVLNASGGAVPADSRRFGQGRNRGASGTAGTIGNRIRVNGNQPWADTGIEVRAGDRLTFSSSGQIRVAQGDAPETLASVDGAGSFQSTGRYPVATAPAGALIGRIGNAAPFGIGSQTSLTMPASGRLFLGVNDDNFGDNSGSFTVTIGR